MSIDRVDILALIELTFSHISHKPLTSYAKQCNDGNEGRSIRDSFERKDVSTGEHNCQQNLLNNDTDTYNTSTPSSKTMSAYD